MTLASCDADLGFFLDWLQLRSTFDALGVKCTQFNIITASDGGEIHAALKEQCKQTTVPYVFIGKARLSLSCRGCEPVSSFLH